MLEIDHDMPAERGDALGDPFNTSFGVEIDQPLDEIEAHALYARLVDPFELIVAEFLADKGDALGLAVGTASSASTSARLSL